MKLVRTIGEKAIALISNDLENELDMDTITSIDHANLYGEIATCSVLLNKVGLLRAQAESEYESAKVEFNIHKAQLSTQVRRESIVNAGKVKVEEIGLVKLTEGSLEDILLINPELNAMQKELIRKKKHLAEIDSLYWALQSKDKKLTNLVPKVTPEEFMDKLVEGEINTFIIKKKNDMEIKLTEEFKVVQCTNAPFLWDLYRIRTAKETGKKYETAEAYGIDLKGIAEKVPYFEVINSAGNAVSFKDFVSLFEERQKKIVDSFLQQAKEINF